MRYKFSVLLLLAVMLMPGRVLANNARDYLPLDPGTFFMALYYEHGFGNEYYHNGSKKNNKTNLITNVSLIRPVYFTQIGPFTIDPQLILPVGELSLPDNQSSGIGDLTLAATIWFINNKESKFILAYTPYFTLPTGQYDRDNGINLGANRWSTKQEITIAKGFGDKTWLEVTFNGQFYTDNNNAPGADNRKVTSSKDPNFGGEAHLSYNFTPAFFGSMDYYCLFGGRTKLDGERQDDEASTHTVGATFAYMLTPSTQLMTYFKTDAAVYNGVRTSTIGLRLGLIF
jgi:hypothetical protein